MSVSIGKSFALAGIDAYPVTVEVDVREGLPAYSTVGLPDQAVSESKNRINAAIKNSGYEFPVKKITVNLAPADIKKEGSAFDFPIALGILQASGIIKKDSLNELICVGELSLDGHLRKICGVLPIALKMKKLGYQKILLPAANAREASIVDGLEVIPVKNLSYAVGFLNNEREIKSYKTDINKEFEKDSSNYDLDFSDIKGQYFAKRAMEIAAAGGHNILMVGPPGAGKTMLAKRLHTILPDLTIDEAVEVTVLQSVVGKLKSDQSICVTRPYRAPHHTISDIALVGGGSIPRPGEISLSHRGVLFLDEFPEFKRRVIEVMRQPLEEGIITVSRAAESVTYPAQFMLVAAMNPCPCGYRDVVNKNCICTHQQIKRYISKLSGPIMDRIDMHIEVPRVKQAELHSTERGEDSKTIRERVVKAREIQNERFKNSRGVFCNSEMKPKNFDRYCNLSDDCRKLLLHAVDIYGLSARGYNKIIKLSRTIADLEGNENISSENIGEALQYRFMAGIT